MWNDLFSGQFCPLINISLFKTLKWNMESDQQDDFFWKSNDVKGWLYQMNWFPRFSSIVVSNKVFVGGTSIWRYIRVIILISFWSFYLADKVIFKYYVLISALNINSYHTEKGNYFHFTFRVQKIFCSEKYSTIIYIMYWWKCYIKINQDFQNNGFKWYY